MSKNIEKKNTNKGLIIGLIAVICILLLYIIIDKSNVVDSNIHKLEEAGYEKLDNGDFKLIKESNTLEDKTGKLLSYYIIKNDYSDISFHYENRLDNKYTFYVNTYDYNYNPTTNIAKGDFFENRKKGTVGNFYHASYDFNNGSLICDASQADCNRFVQRLMELKEEYHKLIDSK